MRRAGRPNNGVVTVTEASARSPRSDWTQPRSLADVFMALDCNGFVRHADQPIGVALVRLVGVFALRVTVVRQKAVLEMAQREADGQPRKWRRVQLPARFSSEPWQVAREALEMLAVLDVDTPVRWG